MTEWNIQSRAHACTACGKSFADKEIFHTLLFDEKAEFRRSDVCQACWEKQYSDGARERKGFVSYWHGVYEAPAPAPVEASGPAVQTPPPAEMPRPAARPAGPILPPLTAPQSSWKQEVRQDKPVEPGAEGEK